MICYPLRPTQSIICDMHHRATSRRRSLGLGKNVFVDTSSRQKMRYATRTTKRPETIRNGNGHFFENNTFARYSDFLHHIRSTQTFNISLTDSRPSTIVAGTTKIDLQDTSGSKMLDSTPTTWMPIIELTLWPELPTRLGIIETTPTEIIFRVTGPETTTRTKIQTRMVQMHLLFL